MFLRRQRQRAEVVLAQKCDQLRLHVQRNIVRVLHRIQIWDQWNGKPVVASDPVVAADDHAFLPGSTASQFKWRFRAHTSEIDRSVTRTGEGSVVAVRFSEEKRSLSPGTR